MKKVLLFVLCILMIQTVCIAKDTIKFVFPNDGWHPVASPDGIQSKKCFVPYNQTSENYTEMLILTEKSFKNTDLTPMAILYKQLGKDKNNYPDIIPEYVVQDMENAIVTWCSQSKNTCAVERVFRGKEGIILAIYLNKAPHYSQNMFGQWVNNLGRLELYEPDGKTPVSSNLIEL